MSSKLIKNNYYSVPSAERSEVPARRGGLCGNNQLPITTFFCKTNPILTIENEA